MIRLVSQDGFEFDLLGSEKIVFTFQNSAPDKIDTFQSDFSTNFNLPNTHRNSGYLEQCFLSISNTTKPYFYINIRVYSNSIEIYPNALLVVKEHNYKFGSFETINVFIVSGVINLKNIIGDKKMADLQTPNIAPSTSFLGTLTASSFDDDYNRGYIYTLVNRGQFPSSQVPDDLVLPDYYAGKIFETIFENVGVVFEFETEPPQWRKLLISGGEIPKIPISNFINNTKGTAGTTGVVNYVMEFDVGSVRFLPITKNTVNENFNNFGYRSSETALYKVKLRYNAKASANVFFAFAGYRLPPVTEAFQFFEVEFFVQLLQFITIFPLPQHETGDVIQDARIHDLIMDIVAIDDARYFTLQPIPINLLLPNIKQWDFIKEMCVRFGLVPSYDLWNDKIIFRIFNNLEFYNVLQDWSNKVDFTQEINTFFTLENFAQQNFFLNAEAEDVVLDSGFLLQDNKTIEQEKDVFVSSFALPNFDVYGNLINEIPSIPIFQNSNQDDLLLDAFTAEYTKNKTNFRLMYLPETKTNFFYAVVSHRRVVSLPALVSVSNIFVCEIENLDWQSILTNYYRIYTKMLDKTLRKQVYILLTENDILNLDFLKVVYIKELNGYWYVNKIEQFESSNTPVRVELIRLFDIEGLTIGNGLKFDGVNDYVTIPCPLNAPLDFDYTDDFSFSVWIRIDANTSDDGSDRGINRIQSGDAVGYDIMFMKVGSVFRTAIAMIGGNGFLYVLNTEPFENVAGQLVHYVFIKDGNNANNFKIYKNGVALNLTIAGNSPQTSSIKSHKPVILNHQLSTSGFNKNDFYDFKAFNKAITPAEVLELFNTKANKIPSTAQSNLVANYTFNQKSSTILLDTEGNNGTLINFANTTPSPDNAWVDENGNSILS